MKPLMKAMGPKLPVLDLCLIQYSSKTIAPLRKWLTHDESPSFLVREGLQFALLAHIPCVGHIVWVHGRNEGDNQESVVSEPLGR